MVSRRVSGGGHSLSHKGSIFDLLETTQLGLGSGLGLGLGLGLGKQGLLDVLEINQEVANRLRTYDANEVIHKIGRTRVG